LTESQTALRGYCRASLGHGEEAAEALQRTNIILWKKNGDWDRSTEFMKWAVAVAKFEVLGVIRDRNRERERYVFDSDVVEMMAEESQVDTHQASQSEATDALEACLSRLSEKNREVLSAYYSQGYSVKEVADRFGKGLSSVKVMLLRLRRKLGECIEQKMTGEGAA
ncbi:MAG: sigma-70 family RNA polymerase sigma factor, partial [Verrucomicrobiota bacterium]